MDRYQLTLSHEHDFAGGWHLEVKAWFTFQELDSRTAGPLGPPGASARPKTTTLQNELFYNGGADVRLRERWGRGNALTFGGVVYHDDAPFRQWLDPNLYAARDDHSGTPRLRQSRTADYQAFFAENVFRLGAFHLVTSVRVDHESLGIQESVRPPNLTRPLVNVHPDRTVPLWAVGFGNDFGRGNETYFNVSRGWRPLRFFDVASPFANLQPGADADPSKSLDYEAGVHGTPLPGLWYDLGLFWIDFSNRIETRFLNAVDVVNVNTGNTRHRGFEGEVSYDFLAGAAPTAAAKTRPDGSGKRHLTVFTNVQLLDAKFTSSSTPGQTGRTPAFAPHTIVKAGLTFREENHYSVSLTGVSVSSQYWQDSDRGAPTLPAKIPSYGVVDFAADWFVTPHLRLLAGVSNLGDEKYYSRVFQTGIEPAPGRTGYAGVALGF